MSDPNTKVALIGLLREHCPFCLDTVPTNELECDCCECIMSEDDNDE